MKQSPYDKAAAEDVAVTKKVTAQWRNLEPTDRSDPTAHDSQSSVKLGDWNLISASIRGRFHCHEGLWREDTVATATSGDWLIACVADGAGSATLSRVGSHMAANKACEYLSQVLGKISIDVVEEDALLPKTPPVFDEILNYLREAVLNARLALEKEAEDRDIPIKDLNTTLLIAILSPQQKYDVLGWIGIGDGLIFFNADSSEEAVLYAGDHTEQVSETRFLTDSDLDTALSNRACIRCFEDSRNVFAVTTDGVSDDFFPEPRYIRFLFDGNPIPVAGLKTQDDQPLRGVLYAFQAGGDRSQALSQWLTYTMKGSHDDRTLALFVSNRDDAKSQTTRRQHY